MSNILILDCTLRDGGYVNDFNFGKNVIADIIDKLSQSRVEIIECGFLVSNEYDIDRSLFPDISSISNVMKIKNPNCMYVAMIQFGAISDAEIEPFDIASIDGIRVTFHEHEIDDALILGKSLMDKGYKIFMQPVGTITYADIDLLRLVERINKMNPYAFYLVDTFGTMYKNDLLRMYYLIDNNLNPDICIGFHSHNNIQLSFSNAQELILLNSSRTIIIDTSAYGMGRGAGNLCTELLMNYININIKKIYKITYILEIIDEHIIPIFKQNPWGYTIPYFIASINECHPNYATYLLDKQTLSISNINHLIELIPLANKALFNKECIEKIYFNFLNHNIDDKETKERLYKIFNNKSILLIAPGNSVSEQEHDILNYISKVKPIIVTINITNLKIPVDYTFISNKKRYQMIQSNPSRKDINIINTSNISVNDDVRNNYFTINYSDYLINVEDISDNAGIMAMNFFENMHINSLALAGFDGFHRNGVKDYYSDKMLKSLDTSIIKKMNLYIAKRIKELSKTIPVIFVTKSIYNKDNPENPSTSMQDP